MNKSIIFLFFISFCFQINAQMNFQDSSAQVITYWAVGESYEYDVSLQKVKYNDSDTLSNETMTYTVDVTVIDSTTDSYTVEWLYKNYKTNSKNPIVQKITNLSDDISVKIRISETGVILEVVNWEEVRDYMKKSMKELEKDYSKLPGLKAVFDQLETMYSTKASLEAIAIQDAQQFHNFHGGRYVLHDTLTGELLTQNTNDITKPFDTNVTILLEDIDEENNEYRIRSFQEINSEQLTESTFQYLKKMSENMGSKPPIRTDIPSLINTTELVSRIHNTGWVLESILWKEVNADGITNMEIRTINLN